MMRHDQAAEGEGARGIPTVAFRQIDDVRRQRRFVVRSSQRVPLCRSMLPQHRAGLPPRHAELAHDMLDAGPPPRGAHHFPEAASFRMTFSSVRSDTAFRSRAFSRSSGAVPQTLQPLHLVQLQTTKLGAPAIIRGLRHTNRSDRLGHRLALARHHLNLPELRNNLLRPMRLLPRHLHPPLAAAGLHCRRTASRGAGQNSLGVSGARCSLRRLRCIA